MRRRGRGVDRRGPSLRWLPAVVVASVLLTGCLEGNVEAVVADDGSGEVVAELLLGSETLGQVDLSTLVSRIGPSRDVEIDTISRAGLDGYRLTVPFDDVTELGAVLVDGIDVLGAPVRVMDSFSLARDATDGSWTLDAVVLPVEQVLAQLGAAGLPGADPATTAGLTLSLSVSLPGTVVRTNAPTSDGGTATWPVSEYRVPGALQMRNEPATFPTAVQLVLGGSLGAVLLGVMLALWGATAAARRRASKGRRRPRRRSRLDRSSGAGDTAAWGPHTGPVPPAGTPPRGAALPPLQRGGEPSTESTARSSDPPTPSA